MIVSVISDVGFIIIKGVKFKTLSHLVPFVFIKRNTLCFQTKSDKPSINFGLWLLCRFIRHNIHLMQIPKYINKYLYLNFVSYLFYYLAYNINVYYAGADLFVV